VTNMSSISGVVQVGICVVPSMKCGFERYVLIASIASSMNTHTLEVLVDDVQLES
jgi:hypothetical protein